MNDNSDLRKQAVQTIANYMHHELFEISGTALMMPFFLKQADAVMAGVDKAVEASKQLAIRKGLAK